MNWELPDVQAGFRKGRRTRDEIANICWIIKKAREFQKNIHFCFIDYAKAFYWENCKKSSWIWEYWSVTGRIINCQWRKIPLWGQAVSWISGALSPRFDMAPGKWWWLHLEGSLTTSLWCQGWNQIVRVFLFLSLGSFWIPLPASPCGSAGKESVCNAGHLGLITRLGRSLGEGKGYPLQYSGLENSMDCIVHRVEKSRKDAFHFFPSSPYCIPDPVLFEQFTFLILWMTSGDSDTEL